MPSGHSNDVKDLSYDDLWRGAWGDLQHFGPVHRHIREDLVRVVTSLRVHSVLDAGCGSGDNLAALASLNRYQLSGTDISSEALAIARRRVPSAQLTNLDLERDALTDQFDLVLSIQVIEHLLDDIAALRHIALMTRKYAFISTMKGRMRPSELAIGHVRNYSEIELQRKIELAGLKVLKIYGWGFPFYSPLYRSLSEWLPGGPPIGSIGRIGKLASALLYRLYRLNWHGRGDVLSVLACRK
jgi:SAM-dependent methyltransferase